MNAAPSTPAVVVTYHPDAGLAERLRTIAREASPVVVVDNSTDPSARIEVARACQEAGADHRPNAVNAGIGDALNAAFAHLHAQGCSAVIAFDQDSTPGSGLAAALHARLHSDPSFALVGANWCDEARPREPSRHLRRRRGFPLAFERSVATQDLTDVTCVITSGTLFRLDVWSELGGFDGGLFLDLVDTDYCLRARAAGFRIAVASQAHLAHRRGSKRAVQAWGRTWWPACMPPRRLRGLFRNRLHVIGTHGWRTPHWVAFELAYSAKILAEVVVAEDDTLAKLAACLRGTWDGLVGRTGPV